MQSAQNGRRWTTLLVHGNDTITNVVEHHAILVDQDRASHHQNVCTLHKSKVSLVWQVWLCSILRLCSAKVMEVPSDLI